MVGRHLGLPHDRKPAACRRRLHRASRKRPRRSNRRRFGRSGTKRPRAGVDGGALARDREANRMTARFRYPLEAAFAQALANERAAVANYGAARAAAQVATAQLNESASTC